MKKDKRALLFYNQMEQILLLYGNDEIREKMDFAKNFLSVNFQINEFESSYIEIEKLHSKRFMWLLVSILIDYEAMKENPKE